MTMRKKNENLERLVKPSRLADVMNDIARFANSHRTFDGKLVRAGRVVVLKVGDKTARVVARGPAGVTAGEISLSSETREKLGVSSGKAAVFTIAEANLADDFLWAWNATDAMPRIAARLGVISIILGIIGALLGLVSVAVSFPFALVPCAIFISIILAGLLLVAGYSLGARS